MPITKNLIFFFEEKLIREGGNNQILLETREMMGDRPLFYSHKKGGDIMNTKEYRNDQFEKLYKGHGLYPIKVKISKANTETNWLDIEVAELETIKNLLTK